MSAKDANAIRFRCPHCQTGLKSKSADAGTRRKCPQCKQVFTVPSRGVPSRQPSPPTQDAANQSVWIPVICGVCDTRMYATAEQIGQFVKCPDCYAQTEVRPPREQKKAASLAVANDFSYDVQPPMEVNAPRNQAHDMLDEAALQVEREIEQKPTAASKPLWTGVVSFLFYPRTLVLCLGMTMALCVALSLIKSVRELDGNAILMAPILSSLAAVVSACVLITLTVCWLKILDNTIQGDDQADYRPDGGLFAFTEWMWESFFVINSVCLSAIPAFLLDRYLEIPSPLDLVLLLSVSALSFPILLLSMLEANSPMTPYSPPIWYSLRTLAGTWLLFYLLSSPVVALGGVSAWGAWQQSAREWNLPTTSACFALVFAVVVCTTVYFRLLGRMGWLLTQTIQIELESTDQGEEESVPASGKDAAEPTEPSIV